MGKEGLFIFSGLVILLISNNELINALAKVVLPTPKSPLKKNKSPILVLLANFFEKLFNCSKSLSNSINLFYYLRLKSTFKAIN